MEIIFSLLGIVGILLLTIFSARWIAKKSTFNSGKVIKIIEKVSITPDKAFAIITVEDKCFLVGITPSHIDKISELDKEKIEELCSLNVSEKMSFSQALSKVIAEKVSKKGGKNNEEN